MPRRETRQSNLRGTCVITGGASGIGRASALHASSAGWDIAVNFREHANAAHTLVAEIAVLGRRAIAIEADVAQEAEATIPMQRYGSVEEVAAAVLWLLDRQSSFVTGAHLNVGGGGFVI